MKENTKNLIDSIEEFDFFDLYNVDMETYELFKYKFDMKFNSRKQPDIFYRNFVIIGMYKSYGSLTVISRLLDLDHTSIWHIIQRMSALVKCKDKQIIEIFEQVKFFFERYGKYKVYKQIAGSSENEFISSITLERQFAIRQAI
jgi:hypothetical protein